MLLWCQVLAGSFLIDDDDDDALNRNDEFTFPQGRLLQNNGGGGGDSTSTRVNIFQKLKESLVLSLLGLLLICVAPCLIWKNEGRHVRELARIDFCQNQAVVVPDVSTPTNELNERLVHFTGTVQVNTQDIGDKLQDDDDDDKLNVIQPVPKALLVRRTVYIYQKFQVAQQSVEQDRLGGGETRTTTYSVRQDWTPRGPQPETLEHVEGETNSRGLWDELVQASGSNTTAAATTTGTTITTENAPAGLAEMLGLHNPQEPPHRQTIARTAHVGGFGLSPAVILAHPRAFLDNVQPVPVEYLPEPNDAVPGLQKGTDNILRTYSEEQGPQNGDIKVVYEYVPDGFDCSFLVRQIADTESGNTKFGVGQCHAVQEHCLGQWNTDLGDVWIIQKGSHNVEDMIVTAKQEEAAMNKILRLVGWFALLAGWIMLFSPFVTALEVLPILSKLGYFAVVLVALLVSVLCCGTVTLLAYFRYRPLLSGSLLALAFGIWGIVIWKLDQAADEGESENM